MLENETRGTVVVEPIENRLFVLVLQHPQEKREAIATAAASCAALRQARLAIGLSWPNLARALGRPADPKRWAVLYLGSARPAALGLERQVRREPRREALATLEAAALLLKHLDGGPKIEAALLDHLDRLIA